MGSVADKLQYAQSSIASIKNTFDAFDVGRDYPALGDKAAGFAAVPPAARWVKRSLAAGDYLYRAYLNKTEFLRGAGLIPALWVLSVSRPETEIFIEIKYTLMISDAVENGVISFAANNTDAAAALAAKSSYVTDDGIYVGTGKSVYICQRIYDNFIDLWIKDGGSSQSGTPSIQFLDVETKITPDFRVYRRGDAYASWGYPVAYVTSKTVSGVLS